VTLETLPPLLVACLCAEWCNVCGEYRSRFAQVQAAVTADHSQAKFVWLDVEDEADLLYPLDVDNFPTILIAVGDAPRFYGPLTPQAQTLERLVRNALADASATPLADPNLVAAVARIRAQKAAGR
jgi:hypothetical protein